MCIPFPTCSKVIFGEKDTETPYFAQALRTTHFVIAMFSAISVRVCGVNSISCCSMKKPSLVNIRPTSLCPYFVEMPISASKNKTSFRNSSNFENGEDSW